VNNNNSFQWNKYSDKCEQEKKYFQQYVYQNQNNIKETPVYLVNIYMGKHHEDKY
jgi:hypothetical protein